MLSIIFVILTIYVLVRAIHSGWENETLTNITVVVGVITTIASIVINILYSHSTIEFFMVIFCFIFAVMLKKIVNFFVLDYDKKHQIDVETGEKHYRFQTETIKGEEDFWDEDKRFNGEFKDYDDLKK